MASNASKKHPPCVILFAKAPIRGLVKTRLAEDLDNDQTVSLYRNFVLDIADKITAAGLHLKIFHYPPGTLALMQDWLGHHHEYFLQEGEDLGRRMANAFARIFQNGVRQAVLTGSDFPDLPAGFLVDALSNLNHFEATIGPTFDGGYYLIGFNADHFLPAVFMDMPWSTEQVFEKTMACFEAAGLRIKPLPKWRDIDTYDDLKRLIRSLARHPDRAPRTAAFLKQTGLVPD